MIKTDIQAQNLRNKYNNHPVIQPLIEHCNENALGFEFLKECVPKISGLKSFNSTNIYYMKIGNNLLKETSEFCGWYNLLDLIAYAYDYLDITKPDLLKSAELAFNRRV